MARPRKPIPYAIEAEIKARTARGESARTIQAAIPYALGLSSVKRLQAELRGKTPKTATRAASRPPSEPEPPDPIDGVPDHPPEDTPVEQLDRWIKKLEQGAATAEKQENLTALASIAAKVSTLMALRHRVTPLPKPDLNENPDFKLLADQGEARLMALLADVFANARND